MISLWISSFTHTQRHTDAETALLYVALHVNASLATICPSVCLSLSLLASCLVLTVPLGQVVNSPLTWWLCGIFPQCLFSNEVCVCVRACVRACVCGGSHWPFRSLSKIFFCVGWGMWGRSDGEGKCCRCWYRVQTACPVHIHVSAKQQQKHRKGLALYRLPSNRIRAVKWIYFQGQLLSPPPCLLFHLFFFSRNVLFSRVSTQFTQIF